MTRKVIRMGIFDAEHYSDEQRKEIIASYPAHEREARTRGIPTLGNGRIFPITQESIEYKPFPIPAHWTHLGGLDFGWDHPTVGVEHAWDRDADVIYVTKTYRCKEQTPVIHAAALKVWGDELKFA